ncbi:MAG: hypothetical protein V3V10_01890 [Planctomycetota bacterium]
MNKDKPARTAAIILSGQPYKSPKQAIELASAMFGDLHELLGAVKLRMPEGDALTSQSQLASAIQAAEGNIIITWADAAATPLYAVSGALDALKSATAVVGPCANGEIYLFGFEGPVDAELAEEISEILFQEKPLDELTNLLDDLEAESVVLPPWFRVKSAEMLSFAENLARLSLLSEDGEDDFIADRLRVWFEENAEE